MSYDKRNEEIRKQRELRRTRGKSAKIKKKRASRKEEKKKTLPVILVMGLLIAIVLTVLSLTVFFKASHVKVVGTTRYETKQIVTAADISSSQNMILLSESKVEERITKTLPYIGRVNVKKNLLTSTVTIEVFETEPFAAVLYNNEYLLIDSSGKFLEKTTVPTCCKIYVEKIEAAELGKMISFGEQDELSILIKLAQTFEKLSIKDITAIDISNSSDVRLLYKDMQIWKLGTKSVVSNAEELEYKLKFCMKESQNEEGKMGVVDVSAMTLADSTKYGYFREEVVTPEEFFVIPTPPAENPVPEASESDSSKTEEDVNEEDDEKTEDELEEKDENSTVNNEDGEENVINDGGNDI